MSWSTFDVFGTPVACLSDVDLAERIEAWAGGDAGHVVCFSDTHGIVKAHDDPRMGHALRSADAVLPDGHPVAWVGRMLHGMPAPRTCGPDFFDLLTARSPATGLSHYLFGGKPGVGERLAAVLQQRHPGISIVGVDAPPMGPSSPQATENQLRRIIASRPDVVWVALGAPKQEIWMAQYRDRLPGITLCGVGAAFDFHTGTVRRAPRWVSERGFEWLYRVLAEPRRLGPRYGRTIPRFFWLLTKQVWRMARSGELLAKPRPWLRRV